MRVHVCVEYSAKYINISNISDGAADGSLGTTFPSAFSVFVCLFSDKLSPFDHIQQRGTLSHWSIHL